MHSSYFLEDSLAAQSHPRFFFFFPVQPAAGIPDGNFGLSWCTAVIPVDQKILHVKVADGKVTVTDWPASNHDVGRILLADQEPSCQIQARETWCDLEPLSRSDVGCHRVELREFDDVPFVGSLVVVVQNSKAQTLVVESKQLHHTPRLVRNQNQKWIRHVFTMWPSWNHSKYRQKIIENLPK